MVNKEANHDATKCAEMKIKVKAINSGRVTSPEPDAGGAGGKICATAVKMKPPWRVGKKYVMTGEIGDDKYA